MQTSETILKIVPTMIKAKREMQTPKKDGINPHFKSKYTTLDELLRCVNKALVDNGLAMFPMLLEEGTKIGCKLRIFHESGEWVESPAFFLPAAQTAQGVGSATTYILRYCISSFWTMGTLDPHLEDDGKGAMPSNNTTVSGKVLITKTPQMHKNKALKMVDDVRKEYSIQDKRFIEMLEENFSKSSVAFLTIEELRKVYKLIITIGKDIQEVKSN